MCVSGLVFDLSLPPFHRNAHAAQVTLAWDAENGVAGYKIYYGTVSKHYTSFIDVGKNTTYTVPNLSDGITYYFAATAYDASNLESDYSNEVSYSSSSYDLLYVNFTGYGLYKYDGTTWTQIVSAVPASMVASGSLIVCNFDRIRPLAMERCVWSSVNASLPQAWWLQGPYCTGTSARGMACGNGMVLHGVR